MSRITYTEEFKRDAVRLVVEQGLPRKRVARDLGVSVGTLREWILQLVPPSERIPEGLPPEEHIRQLERELERTRMERDILKKAVGIFSQMPPRP